MYERLRGQHILLGVTAGIAAYKAVELARLLGKAGAEVRVVMTDGATHFVGELSFQAVTGEPVRRDLFDPAHEAAMGHIELARWADRILIAPATADVLARLAAGMANDLLTTLCLASAAPLAVAPAMNQQMWRHAATRHNLDLLRQRGVLVLGPAEGEQACGDTGPGRMLEPIDLLAELCRSDPQPGALGGVRTLLTAGPTQEPLDPVRFIGNRSSGKMGYALARALRAGGAEVTLVSGPVKLETPDGVERVSVRTAAEMHRAVMARVGEADLFVACAAVADYRPETAVERKIKKTAGELELRLVRNPDILAEVAALADGPFTVGFAAETHDLAEYAEGKRQAKGLDMIAANLVGATSGFEVDDNELLVLWEAGQAQLGPDSKDRLAEQLVALIGERMNAQLAVKDS